MVTLSDSVLLSLYYMTKIRYVYLVCGGYEQICGHRSLPALQDELTFCKESIVSTSCFHPIMHS